MLSPIGQRLRQDLQDRGYHILETLEGLEMGQQLNLACRNLLAMLLLRRPDPSAPEAQRDGFKTLCTEVQVWLRDEIAELRCTQPGPNETASKVKTRQKVGYA